jgi:hypothetical protein
MITNCNAKIKKLQKESYNNELPTYAWPGGYPIFYIDDESNVLCPDCANSNDEYSEPIIDYGINWENETLGCDHCSAHIPSAYGDDPD